MLNIEDLINNLKKIYESQEYEINNLKEELSRKEAQIKNFPQLSQTSVGKATANGKIIYRNWWSATQISDLEGFCDNIWFTRYLNYKFPNEDFKINMFSVFGEINNINRPMEGKKVLFSGENLNQRFLHVNQEFGRYALDYVDFAMGYDLIKHDRYLRFPLWLIWFFPPETTEEDIENKIEYWNSLKFEKSKNVAIVASHDLWNTRSLIVNDIQKITNITFAGSWNNNSSELWDTFKDNKTEFLKQFKFNICPENLSDTAYVTEKIFDSINSDCIPLYLGGKDYMEPEVLNKDAILVWDFDKDNSDSVELFKTLLSDEKSYNEFKDQNVLLDSSSKFIIKKFNMLEKHFENLIYD